VSAVHPKLRDGLHFVEQVYRGEAGFVVKDPSTKKYFRFRPAEARVLRCFDGTRSIAEVAAALADEGMRVTAGAVESFARTLTNIGLLERPLEERTTLQLERLRAERRQRRRAPLFRGELLRMRWSLGDPDALFDRTMPYVRWCFTRPFLIASALLFAAYFAIMASSWNELSGAMAARYSLATFTLGSLLLLWAVFVAVTVIHELAHGYACKFFGGEVHELGVMVIYLQPAMYCNVNDAWSFPDLRARLWVTAAGGWIELAIAGVAAVVWVVVSPGSLLADVAVATMMVAGGMTLLANGNPLLPLDGYFALTDYLEIPNLRLRAIEYVRWWLQRHVLRLDRPEPAVTDRERRVFLVYGTLALTYIGGVFGFALHLVLGWVGAAAGAGGVIATIAVATVLARRSIRQLWLTLATSLRRRATADGDRRHRRRLQWAGGLLLPLLLAAPWPHTATGSFVTAPARVQLITAPSEGVIAEVLVEEGGHVAAGTPLVRMRHFAGLRAVAAASREVDSLTAAESQARARGRAADAEVLAADRDAAVSRHAQLRRRADATTVRALASGVVLTPRPRDLLGRQVVAGQQLLMIGDVDSLELRIAFAGDGALRVSAGQIVRVISDADAAHPLRAIVASRGESSQPGAIEARARVPNAAPWRPGVHGEARAEVGRSTVLGALTRRVRTLVRSDLLL
jgi:putative peptide zinc metalloprotease protein